MAIIEWLDKDEDVFSSVLTGAASFKIILKTKDDPWFIREWYEHHAAIVGPSNLVIFDNGSSDANVLRFYREVSDVTPIFKNSFGVNHIHNVNKCVALYDTLKRTCRFCMVLDTDERLLMLESEKRLAKLEEIVPALEQLIAPSTAYLPTLWLGNAFRSKKYFKFASEADLENALKWGKPVMISDRIPGSFVNHNCQFEALVPGSGTAGRLLLLHLKNLYPDQRISANLRKLESYGFIEPGGGIEAALQCDTAKISKGDPIYWVTEIRSLTSSMAAPEQQAQLLIEEGEVGYENDTARALMRTYLAMARPMRLAIRTCP